MLLVLLCLQAAQSVNKALEQFVKPEQLDGENSYKCSKYGGAGGWGAGRLAVKGFGVSARPARLLLASGAAWEDPGSLFTEGQGIRVSVLTLLRPRGGGSSLLGSWVEARGKTSHTLVPLRVKVLARVGRVCQAASPVTPV